MLVATWMTADPVTVTPHARLKEAEDLMTKHEFRHLPVVDQGKLVGILTMNDVRKASPSPATTLSRGEVNYLLDQIVVSDVMTRDPITVGADTPVEDAALLAYRHKIGALPVVQEGRLVGIITQSDLFDIMMSIFQAGEGNRRISIEGMPRELGSFRKVVDILDEYRTPFSSILVFPQRDSGLYTYFVRVPDRQLPEIIEALKVAGMPATHVS